MFMSSVADPRAFSKESLSEKGYRKEAKLFLMGVLENTFLIVDPDGKLQEELKRRICGLPTQQGQELSILLEEILKNKEKRIVKCLKDVFSSGIPGETLNLCYEIKEKCRTDALVASYEAIEEYNRAGKSIAEVVPLSDYSDSYFEKKRRKFLSDMPPIGQMEDKDANEIIVRIIKFTKWLRFYDKQIGKGDRLRAFRMGISHILKLWLDQGHFAKAVDGPVEIITSPMEYGQSDESEYVRERKEKNNKERVEKIFSDLIKPLQKEFPWKIELKVKKDPQNIFHARHIQAQSAIVLFERGFDLFNNGTFKRAIIKVDNGSSKHLAEYRQLPE